MNRYLERKTCEPIARREGLERKPVQCFVGAGKWDDEAVMTELRRHVCQEFGAPRGVLILDGCTFPKKGTESCGVKRQWCGRLGKVENCQAGVFLTYATPQGCAPLERRLFLPEDRAADRRAARRTEARNGKRLSAVPTPGRSGNGLRAGSASGWAMLFCTPERAACTIWSCVRLRFSI